LVSAWRGEQKMRRDVIRGRALSGQHCRRLSVQLFAHRERDVFINRRPHDWMYKAKRTLIFKDVLADQRVGGLGSGGGTEPSQCRGVPQLRSDPQNGSRPC
jgi:hypothetical protein